MSALLWQLCELHGVEDAAPTGSGASRFLGVAACMLRQSSRALQVRVSRMRILESAEKVMSLYASSKAILVSLWVTCLLVGPETVLFVEIST